MSDAILRRLWRVKDALAEECEMDVAKLAAYLRTRDYGASHPVVDLRTVKKAATEQEIPQRQDGQVERPKSFAAQ